MLANASPRATAVLLGLFVVLAIVSVLWTGHSARVRRDRMRTWARARAYTFDPKADKRFHKRLSDFPTFRQGSARRALNTATFTIDALGATLPARLGDYTYTVAAGQGTITYRLTYLLITLPMGDHPPTGLRPERLSDRLNAALGFNDINFEDAAFSKRYYVSSKDKRFAYDLLDPRTIELLKSTPHPANIEIAHDRLLLTHGYKPGLNSAESRWSPEQCDERIALAQAFLEHWPTHLRVDEGATP